MLTSFYEVKCRYLHCVSLKLAEINPASTSLPHGLLIDFDFGPSVQTKGEIILLDSLVKKRHCVYSEPLSTHLLILRINWEQAGQAGKLDREEPDEVQQGQVQGAAPGEEQPHALLEARGGPAGEQLCGEGPGSASG